MKLQSKLRRNRGRQRETCYDSIEMIGRTALRAQHVPAGRPANPGVDKRFEPFI
jgi:hypothetical protein